MLKAFEYLEAVEQTLLRGLFPSYGPGAGVGVSAPECAQYLPPVFKALK